ncbi:unnamed protein product [Caenorhabditis sp. 36 PRJEB53466]|nr:unnamed protein product [Caenorhabditis sp. 36 PRJEB53466]
MRRNSLTSMLGEFVGFHRSPGMRLSSLSNQELNQAVKDEKKTFLEQEAERPEKRKPRQRYLSEGDIRVVSAHPVSVSELKKGINGDRTVMRVSSNPEGSEQTAVNVVMRSKNPKRKDRPTSLIERIRRKISYTRTGAIIESDEEKDHDNGVTPFPRRRDSTRSERLFIPITPVETVPIRIVQVRRPFSIGNRAEMRVAVITVSDSCSAGTRVDESGPKLVELVDSSPRVNATVNEGSPALVPDEIAAIRAALLEHSKTADVIITTGGTGFSKRDVTPEATLQVIERRCSALEIALHTRSLQATPMAALSRAIVGIRGSTLIVNMPGSVKAVKECWETIEPILNHAIDLLKDTDDGSQHARMK